MKDTMQFELPRPDLSVWEKTFLPTTSSKIKHLLNGRHGATSSVSRPSEDGGMVYLERNLFAVHPKLTESSSSQSEESWNSWGDIKTSSSETLCPYSTWVLMEQPEKLAHLLEVTTDESTSGEWQQTRSTSGTSLVRTVSGSLRRITSWIASVIRRIGN